MPFVLLLLLVPTAFINRDDKLDWGDDNFHYLHQAEHLWNAEGAGYLVNPQDYGPAKKGLFFSFLLSFNFSESVSGYKIIVLLSYFFCGLCLFFFYSRHFSNILALILTLCFLYHPYSVAFKNEILAEFLFTGLLFLILFLLHKKNCAPWQMTVLFVLLVHTRDVGIFVYLVYLLSLVTVKAVSLWSKLRQAIMSVVIFTACYCLINHFLYPIPSTGGQFYLNAFSSSDLLSNIQMNAPVYRDELLNYLEFESPQGFNDGLKVILLLFMLLGITETLQKKEFFLIAAFGGYLIILLCYPNQAGARRFLLPMFPFLLLFVIRGVKWVFERMNRSEQFSFAALTILLVIFVLELKTVSLRKSNSGIAANDPQVLRDLEKIQAHTNESSVIGFKKPYAVIYYSGRKSFALTESSAPSIPKEVTHLLFRNEERKDKKIQKLINSSISTVDINYFYLIKTK